MSETKHLLNLWAAEYRGFYPHLIDAAARQALLIEPPWASAVERTVLGRWVGLVTWLRYITEHELHVPLEDAPRFWRGLRAVAENRAAPMSPLGSAIVAVIADIRRLPLVTAADQMLLGLALADVLDGLASQYRWRLQQQPPSPAEALIAHSRATGTLGLYASLGAVRQWELALVLPAHPVRRMIASVSDVRGLLLQPDPDTERLRTLLRQVQHGLGALTPQQAELREWTLQLIVGTEQWANDQLQSAPTPSADQ